MSDNTDIKLTRRQEAFVQNLIQGMSQREAYKKAGYKVDVMPDEMIDVEACKLLKKPKVAQRYEQLRSRLVKEAEDECIVTAKDVLKRFWEIANADPNEIIQLRRLNCRYCHGNDHNYQWKDEDEYNRAVQSAIEQAQVESEQKGQPIEPVIPSDAGGYGYDPLADPNPDCPKCDGEGVPDLHIADTRKLSPAARRLYAGIKQTQSGIEVKMHDQLKALEYVARHLGMFTDRVEQKIEVTHRLEDLL